MLLKLLKACNVIISGNKRALMERYALSPRLVRGGRGGGREARMGRDRAREGGERTGGGGADGLRRRGRETAFAARGAQS